MSIESTGTETSTSSIGDDLAAAFDSATSTDDPSTTAEAAAPSPTTTTASGEQNAEQIPLEAHKHWPDADKSIFSTLPRQVQQRWLDREKEQQRGLDAKFQEIAGFRREREVLDEMFQPYSRDLELAGVNRPQFIQSLLGGHKYLQESPREAVLWLCNQYGVDPTSLTQTQDDGRDPKITSELSQLKAELQSMKSSHGQREHQETLSKVQGFAQAKGDDGKPLHPYFDEVGEEIVQLMKAGEKNLETAYAKAIRMNDAVWDKVQAEKSVATQKAADAKRQAEIDKAKRAAVGSEGRSSGSAKDKSLQEELADGFSSWGQ